MILIYDPFNKDLPALYVRERETYPGAVPSKVRIKGLSTVGLLRLDSPFINMCKRIYD